MSVSNTTDINSKTPDSTASSSWSSFRSRWSWTSSTNKDTSAAAVTAPKTDEKGSTDDNAQQSATSLPEHVPASSASASASSKWSFRQMWASSSFMAASSSGKVEANMNPPLVLDESTSFDQLEEDEELDVELLVPGIISITVRQTAEDTQQKFWWKLILEKTKMTSTEEEKEKNQTNEKEEKGGGEEPDVSAATSSLSQIVVSGFLPQSSLGELQERTHTTFLQPGDILKSFNYCECGDMELTDFHALLDDSGGGLVTLVARRPHGDPGLVQANVVTFHATHMSNVQGEEDDLMTGLSFRNRSTAQQRQDNDNLKQGVALSEKSMDGFFAHSVLECNDQLVAINGMNCLECSTEEVELLLQSKFWGADYVRLLAKRKRTQDEDKRWSMRKAAVAATGGSMVPAGAVIMVTPLHPVGHPMPIGGVAVLGTEFEAPRRALESARRSFQGLSNKSSKDDDDEDDEDVGSNVDDKKPKGKSINPFDEGESGSFNNARPEQNTASNNPFDDDEDEDDKGNKKTKKTKKKTKSSNPFDGSSGDDDNNDKKPKKEKFRRSSKKKKQGNPTRTNPFDDDINHNNNHTAFRQQSTLSSNELSDVSLGAPKNPEKNGNTSFNEQRRSWKEQLP